MSSETTTQLHQASAPELLREAQAIKNGRRICGRSPKLSHIHSQEYTESPKIYALDTEIFIRAERFTVPQHTTIDLILSPSIKIIHLVKVKKCVVSKQVFKALCFLTSAQNHEHFSLLLKSASRMCNNGGTGLLFFYKTVNARNYIT